MLAHGSLGAIRVVCRNRIEDRFVKVIGLLVDTGAPMCNLDAELTREAKGEVVERTLSIGTWSGMVRWRVKDLAVTRQALGSTATLGNNFFNRHVVDFRVLEQTLLLR